jgi:hypothetical protein
MENLRQLPNHVLLRFNPEHPFDSGSRDVG